MIHKSEDLSPDQIIAIESLLGRSVVEGEAISVRVFPSRIISDEQRERIAEKLRAHFAEVDVGRDSNVSPSEAENIIDEAIRSNRPGYHTHR